MEKIIEVDGKKFKLIKNVISHDDCSLCELFDYCEPLLFPCEPEFCEDFSNCYFIEID